MENKRIAIIDDELDVRETLKEILENDSRFELNTFPSLDEFLRVIDNDPAWNLVISDVHMPTGSGLRLSEELKARNLEIPTIFFSGMVDMIPQSAGRVVLRKPIAIETLLETIEKLL